MLKKIKHLLKKTPTYKNDNVKEHDNFRLMHESYNPYPNDPDFVYDAWLPQIMSFAKDIYPYLEKYVQDYRQDDTISLLDVGGGIGAGTEFFRSKLQRFLYLNEKKSQLHATILELDLKHKEWAEHFYPKCNFINTDIFNIHSEYDFVTASHVIEHVIKPFDFIRQLKKITRDKVIIYAPYNEEISDPPGSHVVSITMDLIESLDPIEVALIHSDGWVSGQCILAVFNGIK